MMKVNKIFIRTLTFFGVMSYLILFIVYELHSIHTLLSIANNGENRNGSFRHTWRRVLSSRVCTHGFIQELNVKREILCINIIAFLLHVLNNK